MKHLFVVLALLLATSAARADAFDDYDSVHLKKVANSPDHAEKVKRLTRDDLVTAVKALPRIEGVFLVVHTNDDRWSKLIVSPGAQKIDMETKVPLLLVERFVTYKEGEERARVADGKNVRLFPDFRLNFDIGAIVPEKNFAADLRFISDKGETYVEPLGKAELYLVTKHLAEATPAKGGKVIVGPKFEPALFAGKYTVYDNGKPPSELTLKVGPKGEVTGWMFGAAGNKYEVQGQVGPNPMFGIQFTVQLPRTAQTFTGWMFTGDASAIAGYSAIENRETGFYAVRQP